jgi:two-component sensor histidine kinase
MPNSKLSRNAEYVSNAQLSQASSPENRPLDSTKTQFISGMLLMQSRSASPTDAVGQLKTAADRVAAVARVHRHFYAEEATETVSCITFIKRLCADLSSILGTPISVIQPIGLLVNELVTNAAKYGAGKIDVSYHADGRNHTLAVCDHGAGLPSNFDLETSETGLGMKVIRLLAKQLRGTITAHANPGGTGACFTVKFPI